MDPKYIIIHTAAHGTKYVNQDTSAKNIDIWHKANGWRGIGYHEVVRLDGTIEEGRRRNERGAHCTSMGMNSQSTGICFSGHGDYHQWTEEQERAGILLIAATMKGYNIPIENVLGHRETGARKTCPGKLINMDRVRRLVLATDGSGESEPPYIDPPPFDFTGMFRSICDIFDDPAYHDLPDDAKRMVKHLRLTDPFKHMNREDI